MKLFYHGKDGGSESNVSGYWLVEIKSVFSIALLKFTHGSREAYHNHAFNSVSWLIRGGLEEEMQDGIGHQLYTPSFKPIVTKRSTFHKVFSYGTSWVLTFRGPWNNTWKEYLPTEDKTTTLTHGRRIL